MQRFLSGVRALMPALIASLFLPLGAMAQLAVSANDNKVTNAEGRTVVVENAPPDTVTIINLGVSPPRVIGEVKAPASVTGPACAARHRFGGHGIGFSHRQPHAYSRRRDSARRRQVRPEPRRFHPRR